MAQQQAQGRGGRSNGAGWRRGFQILLIVCAAAGAALCAVLLAMSLPATGEGLTSGHGPGAGGLGARLCAPTARVNCDYVLASRWSRIGGVSTSLLGLAYFAAAGAWFAAVGLPNYAGRRWHGWPMALTAAGAAMSAWFVWVMAAKLPAWCTWCLAAHAVNGVMAVLTWAAWPRRADGLAAHPTAARGWGVLGGCAATAAAAALGAWSVQLQAATRQMHAAWMDATNDAAYIAWRLSREPVHEIELGPGELAIGPADAKHTIVVFSDFECAQCRLFHQYARRMANIFSGAARVVLKHYPMSPACNPAVKSAFHYFACEAAAAAEAARLVGGDAAALSYHLKLYDLASRLDERPYAALAMQLGLDGGAFEAAMASPAVRERIEQDVALAKRLGVEGTPGLFVDGRRMRTSWHIVKGGVRPSIDLEATDALWGQLLGEGAVRE